MASEDTVLEEIDARTADLARINAIFDGGDEEKYADLSGLLEDVMKRNNEFQEKLAASGFESIDRVPDANQKWQDEVYKLAARFAQMRQDLVSELKERTEDMDKVIDALKGTAPLDSLDEVLAKADQRHADQKERVEDIATQLESEEPSATYVDMAVDFTRWEDLIKKAKGGVVDIDADAVKGNFGKVLAECLMNEMAGRKSDLEKLTSEEPAAVKATAKERQQVLEDKLKTAADGAPEDEEFKADARAEIIDDYVSDDQKWLEALDTAGQSPADGVKSRAQRDLAREELIGRVDDLAALRELIKEKDAGEIDEEGLIDRVGDLVRGIKVRHDDIEPKVEEQLTEADIDKSVAMLVSVDPDAVGGVLASLPPAEEVKEAAVELKEEDEKLEDVVPETASAPGPPPPAPAADAEAATAEAVLVPPTPPITAAAVDPTQEPVVNILDAVTEDADVDSDSEAEEVAADGGDVTLSGDSMAAPFVTGALALVKSEFPEPPPVEMHVSRPSKVEVRMTPMEAFRQNDLDWRNAFKDLIRSALGVEPPPDEEEKKWWLDLDSERVEEIDAIQVYEARGELLADAVFLDRVLRPKEGVEDRHRSLYIPFYEAELDEEGLDSRDAAEQLEADKKQPDWDNHVILSTLFDGAMCGFFLDMCQPEFMDTRVIHEPEDMAEPRPLKDEWVVDNVQLVLSSAKALGLRLPTYDSLDWMNAEKHVPLLLELLKQLANKQLEQFVNMAAHPEMVRLTLDEETADMIEELTHVEFIPRWINRALQRPLKSEITDFNNDLMRTLAAIDSTFVPPVKDFSDDPLVAAESLLAHVKGMGLDTSIQAVDLVAENGKLQQLLAAQLFHFKNGIPELTKRERARFKSVVMSDAIHSADEAMVNFLNSLLTSDYAIRNLHKDLNDGVVLLKILDKVEPGVVDWKKVRDRGKIRHKFDKMGNCKYAIEVCGKEPLHLETSTACGQDLHDGNQKVIHSLLWQVMRYQAMKTLRELSFEGKHIDEKDILKWANDTIEEMEERTSTALKHFKDKQLCTAVFYLELFEVIIPGAVRTDLIAYDIEPIKDLRRDRDEEGLKKRLMNARYAMTLARREGAELFVLPEDLVVLQPKAVLSMFAGLMTIWFHEKKFTSRRSVIGKTKIDAAALEMEATIEEAEVEEDDEDLVAAALGTAMGSG